MGNTSDSAVSSVGVDDRACGELVAKAFAESEKRRPCYVGCNCGESDRLPLLVRDPRWYLSRLRQRGFILPGPGSYAPPEVFSEQISEACPEGSSTAFSRLE